MVTYSCTGSKRSFSMQMLSGCTVRRMPSSAARIILPTISAHSLLTRICAAASRIDWLETRLLFIINSMACWVSPICRYPRITCSLFMYSWLKKRSESSTFLVPESSSERRMVSVLSVKMLSIPGRSCSSITVISVTMTECVPSISE